MLLTVDSNSCITPLSIDKSIYFLTLSVNQQNTDETLQYAPGDWLTIQPENRDELVDALLSALSLRGDETVELRRNGEVSVKQALTQHIEISQLNPAILNKLQRQQGLGSWDSRQAMMDYAYGKDILDLLTTFPELKQQGVEFLKLLSPLAPRYYSIASAPNERGQVSLLYKAVQYENADRKRFGVASNYMAQLQAGQVLEVEVKPNPLFTLPEDSSKPVIMVGAGTGLAPFIGFMQQRAAQQQTRQKCAINLLFFGETYQQSNCLFCDEFKAWQEKGLVQTYYAFSRDQPDKVYVQQRLLEQAEKLWLLLSEGTNFYICGSQFQLAESVKQTMLTIFQQQGKLTEEAAAEYWQTLKTNKQLQLDVY